MLAVEEPHATANTNALAYLKVLYAGWRHVLAATVGALIVAVGAFLFTPNSYAASSTLYISAQGASDNTTMAYQGSLLSQQRVSSYTELIESPRVVDEVAAALPAGLTGADIARCLTATANPETVLITLTCTSRSPQLSADVANRASQTFIALVAELEQPLDRTRPPSVAARLVQGAAPPSEAVAPQLTFYLGAGFVLGLLLGIGLVVLRRSVDQSVKDAGELERATGVANVGSIGFDSTASDHPVSVVSDPHSPRSEEYRRLRTNLQYVNVDMVSKTFVVTSALASEGKTTTTVNVGVALAASGFRVLLVEADLRKPHAAELLGLERAAGLTSILAGRVGLREVVQRGPGGLDFLSSGPLPPNPSELLGSERMRQVVAEARQRYEYILVDAAPLLPVADTTVISPLCDGVLVVAKYGGSSFLDIDACLASLRAVRAKCVGTILCMVPAQKSPSYYGYYSSSSLSESSNATQPVAREGEALAAASGNQRPTPRPRA